MTEKHARGQSAKRARATHLPGGPEKPAGATSGAQRVAIRHQHGAMT